MWCRTVYSSIFEGENTGSFYKSPPLSLTPYRSATDWHEWPLQWVRRGGVGRGATRGKNALCGKALQLTRSKTWIVCVHWMGGVNWLIYLTATPLPLSQRLAIQTKMKHFTWSSINTVKIMFKMGLLDPDMHRTNIIQNMKKRLHCIFCIDTNTCGTYVNI
jgi:hypothetical protein